jgi:hypothetical protein
MQEEGEQQRNCPAIHGADHSNITRTEEPVQPPGGMAMTRLTVAVVAQVSLALSLLGQEQTGRQDLEQLRPLAERLVKAVEMGDVQACIEAVDALGRAIEKFRPTTAPTGKPVLALFESAAEGKKGLRPKLISRLALEAEKAGEFDKARQYAMEALEMADKGGLFKGEQVFYGNQVLGLLALRERSIPIASRLLVKSLEFGEWTRFAKTGPYLLLAKRLLEAQEAKAVLEFLEGCKARWPDGRQKLDNWQAVIRTGGIPDFFPHDTVAP